MKMRLKKLKSSNIKINFKVSAKSFFIGLISFSIAAIFIGITFYLYLNSSDKNAINNGIASYFDLKDYVEYKSLFLDSLFNNLTNSIILWILGISIIGFPIILMILFSNFFSLGIAFAGIINNYKALGILGCVIYIFPDKLLYLISLFILSFLSCKFSYKLISYIFLKKDINLHIEIKKYLRTLLIIIILCLIISIFEVYFSPFMIKFFTFFTK